MRFCFQVSFRFTVAAVDKEKRSGMVLIMNDDVVVAICSYVSDACERNGGAAVIDGGGGGGGGDASLDGAVA